MNTGQPKVLVVGVGTVYRSDDGIGIFVAQQLRRQVPAGVTILEQSGEGAALIESWNGFDAVIVVDAAHSKAPPGTIYRLDANVDEIPKVFFHYSTHAFSVAEGIQLARALELLPARLIVYAIEGHTFAPGVGLSNASEQAAQSVINQILNESRALPSAANVK
jgi:hydrogenase maturation protease